MSGGFPICPTRPLAKLEKATKLAGEMGDQYKFFLEHFIGIIIREGIGFRYVEGCGMTEKETRAAIDELRKGSKKFPVGRR